MALLFPCCIHRSSIRRSIQLYVVTYIIQLYGSVKKMNLRRHTQFLARTIFVKNNDIEKAARTINRILNAEGLFQQYRLTRYFERPTRTRRRINFEKCKAIYDEDMTRKIQLLTRTVREEPYPGCS
ncbi:28S ribosomal protein S21, mitochondrial-like [Vespa mandarinia]|uniref:28S ribosomal protein S21, mitochondrial-like n=1 Tax=Vespa mandarinia TaxID=7446 RepID=UPI00160DB195|nr:28S ribosomal protein S21, mitochondrial-like [Vespa mandarinia]XP_035729687.1 28S ribosomal protein S21, mitochondrial-like [Vespa mandarinia]